MEATFSSDEVKSIFTWVASFGVTTTSSFAWLLLSVKVMFSAILISVGVTTTSIVLTAEIFPSELFIATSEVPMLKAVIFPFSSTEMTSGLLDVYSIPRASIFFSYSAVSGVSPSKAYSGVATIELPRSIVLGRSRDTPVTFTPQPTKLIVSINALVNASNFRTILLIFCFLSLIG